MVEGVQQLETYFGQYLPQLAVAALTPVLIFAFVAFLDLPIALVLLVAALVTLIAPALWHRRDSAGSLARSKAYARVRRRLPRLHPGPGHPEGLRPERRRGAKLLETRGGRSSAARCGCSAPTRWPAASPTRHRARRGGRARLGRLPRGRTARWSCPCCSSSSCWASRCSGRCASCASSSTRACSGSPPPQGIFALLDARPAVRGRRAASPSGAGAALARRWRSRT